MALEPFAERGTPLEKQWQPVKSLVRTPYNKDSVDELSRLRVIDSYGMEMDQWHFYHSISRHNASDEIRGLVAQIRRTEDQHRAEIAYMFDPNSTIAQVTIPYEHLAVAKTAAIALDEPDSYVRQVLDYALLEDYDHLQRFTILLDQMEHIDANKLTMELVEIKPGRPTWEEHLHPLDTMRDFFDSRKADPLTKLHAYGILAAEQQTHQYYAQVSYWLQNQQARQLYAEIDEIEEQHVSQYEAIIDPRTSWLEMAIDHEYNEIYTYNGYLQEEKDPAMREVWERHLHDELEHLRLWNQMYGRLEGQDATQLWPTQLPKAISFGRTNEINNYVKQVLANQVNLRADGKRFIPRDQLPSNWASAAFQREVQADQMPSIQFKPQAGPMGGGIRM
jgi:rubrerythrin